jgi:hypothetical protein
MLINNSYWLLVVRQVRVLNENIARFAFVSAHSLIGNLVKENVVIATIDVSRVWPRLIIVQLRGIDWHI